MVCSTFNPLTLQKYQPDPEDLCSLCGGNHGKAAMIECKDKIHICLNCVDVLVDIKDAALKLADWLKRLGESIEANFKKPEVDDA